MKVLIIGLGSMGKRRIRNLQSLGARDIYGYDNSNKTCLMAAKEYKIKIIDKLEKLNDYKFDFVVISTPPQHHLEFVKLCIKYKIPFFSEFNLLTKDTLSIAGLVHSSKVMGIPSNTELYDRDVLTLGKLLPQNFRGYFVFHLGQNIHDWHPWQRPGEHFIFHPQTNGIREYLRVELPWIIKTFGEIKKCSAENSAFFTKRFNIKDLICIQIEFKNKNKGIIIFDLIASSVIKRMTIVSDKENIEWDERNNNIEIFKKSKKRRTISLRDKKVLKNYKFNEDAHLAEMKYVLDVVDGKQKLGYTFSDELKLLKIIDKIERLK